jgi:hypothetical protein
MFSMLPTRNIVRVTLMVLALAGLAACAPAFAYRHADWLVVWKIDQYVDLNREQRGFVKNRLKQQLARHRAEALPVYEQFLTQVKTQAADGLTRDEVDWMFERYQQLRADLIQRVLQDGVVLLTSMNDGQVQHLKKVLRKENEKAERQVTEKMEKRLAKRASSALELLQDWLGSMSREQEQRIRELTYMLPDNDHPRLAYLKAGQQDLLGILQSKRDRQLLQQRLQDWLLSPGRVAPAYSRSQDEMREGLKRMALDLDRMITPRQRAHALNELQGLIDDIHLLATT